MRAFSKPDPLIHVSWIDRLDLLPVLFEKVLVPEAVRRELLRADPDVPGVAALQAALAAGWLRVQLVEDGAAIARLEAWLDAGEAEALTLAVETRADLLLVDERRAGLGMRRGRPMPDDHSFYINMCLCHA